MKSGTQIYRTRQTKKKGWQQLQAHYNRMQLFFSQEYTTLWGNLSRFNNLMIIVNISMFFLTGLVANGYYYTCYSLMLLSLVGTGGLIPTRLLRHLWYYGVFFLLECIALYFLAVSIIFWINQGGGLPGTSILG